MVGRAEAQEVEARHRPRAHGEDVAQDAADPGRRALVGLDERGVVVALHLEDDRVAVADVDDAGVLARPLDHPRRLGRQLLQVEARRLVGTVLVPHRRDDAELGVARRPPDQGDEPLIFLGFQPVRDRQRLVDLRFFVAQQRAPPPEEEFEGGNSRAGRAWQWAASARGADKAGGRRRAASGENRRLVRATRVGCGWNAAITLLARDRPDCDQYGQPRSWLFSANRTRAGECSPPTVLGGDRIRRPC